MIIDNPYVDVTPFENGTGFPIVNYSELFLQEDEKIIFATPAQTFLDKEKILGYTGKSGGVSFRVSKGVSVRTGQTASQAIRGNVRDSNYGDLIVTNKRVVFTGKDDRFEYMFPKLTAIKMLDSNSFVIQSGKSSKNIYCDEVNAKYAYGFINFIAKETNSGSNVLEKISHLETTASLSKENIKTTVLGYEPPKHPTETIPEKKPSKTKGCLIALLKGTFGIVVLLTIIGFFINRSEDKTNAGSEKHSVKAEATLSDTDLLSLEGHPRIYDSFEEAKSFYEKYDHNKIKLFESGYQYTSIESNLKNFSDDKTLMYMISDASSDRYISWIVLNFYSDEFQNNMNLDKCVEYVFNYLPDDFLKYYKQDSCYQYGSDKVQIYVSSFRLNEDGIEAYNAKSIPYPYYYSFRVRHLLSEDKWDIHTDLSAYGGQDLDWIQKYSEPWDLDLTPFHSN